ncbi:SGNH hydrolase [Microthyrium microscopicum]|uniref:SGNH hydrolase n=1 Tax=Microthyrium microscopicum TaxID=703497 RepID=A0A6A6UR11_9PEZI|nr:SGNH hydrolase [Microthyrium microscopicum]
MPFVIPSPAEGRVKLVTIFFGANDSCYPVDDPNMNQCVPLPNFRANLIKLITHPAITAHPGIKLVLITPPPIDEAQQFAADQVRGFTQPRRSAANTKAYADMVRTLGQERGIAVVDLWTRFVKHAGWKEGDPLPGLRDREGDGRFLELFTDGLHLSPKGYRELYDEFWVVLRRDLPNLAPENFDVRLPYWNAFPPDWVQPVDPEPPLER